MKRTHCVKTTGSKEDDKKRNRLSSMHDLEQIHVTQVFPWYAWTKVDEYDSKIDYFWLGSLDDERIAIVVS